MGKISGFDQPPLPLKPKPAVMYELNVFLFLVFCSEISYDPSSSSVRTCLACARRRAERKELIAEIAETEAKYGRDLGIVRDEFMRPMQVREINFKA